MRRCVGHAGRDVGFTIREAVSKLTIPSGLVLRVFPNVYHSSEHCWLGLEPRRKRNSCKVFGD